MDANNNNQNNQVKLCPACGAKNKSVYKFCNECGEPLNNVSYQSAQNGGFTQASGGYVPPAGQAPYGGYNQPAQQGYYQNPYGGQYNNQPYAAPGLVPPEVEVDASPAFDDVSARDMYEFTGKKISLFRIMQKLHFVPSGSKYCWPLFLFGLFFGLWGMGFWYLYHKLYKPAVGFLSAAVATTTVSLLFVYLEFEAMIDIYPVMLEKTMGGDITASLEMSSMLMESMGVWGIIYQIYSSLLSVGVLALAIILPFFAYKTYKKNALKKIRAAYSLPTEPNISKLGGTKGGLVAILASVLGVTYIDASCVIVFSFIPDMIDIATDAVTDYNNTYGYNYDLDDFADEYDDYDYDYDYDYDDGGWY